MEPRHPDRGAAVAVADSFGDAGADARWLAWRVRGARQDGATARVMNSIFVLVGIILSGWVLLNVL